MDSIQIILVQILNISGTLKLSILHKLHLKESKLEISLKLDDNEKANLLATLGREPGNYILLSQSKDGGISISHKILNKEHFLRLFRTVLDGDYVEELMQQIPQEVLAMALEQTQNELKQADNEEFDLDAPAILPSEVLKDDIDE